MKEDVDEKWERLKEEAVSRNEAEVWAKARRLLEDELAKARDEAEREKATIRATCEIDREKAVRAETRRMEAIATSRVDERAKIERATAERQLRASLDEAKRQYAVAEAEAIARAREDERRLARDESERVARAHRSALENERRLASQRQSEALAALKARMLEERDRAVDVGKKVTAAKANEELSRVKGEHRRRVGELERVVDRLNVELESCRGEMERIDGLRVEAETKLVETTREFAKFIDRVPGYSSEYLLK